MVSWAGLGYLLLDIGGGMHNLAMADVALVEEDGFFVELEVR